MDDQRLQMQWETSKPWLEDPVRSSHAQMAIDALSQQTTFVVRRGLVSKMRHCYETATIAWHESSHQAAAQDLATALHGIILSSLQAVPLDALRGKALRVPALLPERGVRLLAGPLRPRGVATGRAV